jgi:polysaccharide pyruvyl transferase WcaK-like protein
MKLNAPFGFFGAGNIGDESTLQGFAKLISHYGNGFDVWVASRNPAHTKKAEPAFRYYKAQGRDPWRRWARFRSSAEVIVGGTPIMDNLGKWPLNELTPLVRAAQQQGKPIVFVGSGVEELKREESRGIVAEMIAPVVRHWTVRSDRDKQRLVRYGIAGERVTVAGDLAWTLEAVSDHFGRKLLGQLGVNPNDQLVGVNLNGESFVLDQEPELFSKMAKFLDALVEERNSRVLFFANEVREGDGYDKAAAIRTIAFMKHQRSAYLIPNVYRSPQQTLSLIDCCDLTVSMRYHFCLFSALQGVPFIALKRSDKVDDLCWDLNWPYGVFPTDLDPGVLLDMGLGIEQDRAAVADRLQQQVKSMRQRTLENSVALDALGS